MMIVSFALILLAQRPEIVEFKAGGLERAAVVYRPSKKSTKTPVVLVFHGHGGRGAQIARSRPIHELWPEAAVIYPNGLTGVKGITDPEGKRTGWQKGPDTYDDRDLILFDVILEWAKKEFDADPKRTFVTGHSNGSQFSWLLQAERGDKITAVAGSCAPGGLWMRDGPKKPAFIIAGTKDQLVSIDVMRRFSNLMVRWYGYSNAKSSGVETVIYEGQDAPLWIWEYDGGHRVPADAATRIVAFFRASSL
ncbi:MAG: esterase [Armatimonadetes bacterium]|nr:esterase [Armatimonadota bacterium]